MSEKAEICLIRSRGLHSVSGGNWTTIKTIGTKCYLTTIWDKYSDILYMWWLTCFVRWAITGKLRSKQQTTHLVGGRRQTDVSFYCSMSSLHLPSPTSLPTPLSCLPPRNSPFPFPGIVGTTEFTSRHTLLTAMTMQNPNDEFRSTISNRYLSIIFQVWKRHK